MVVLQYHIHQMKLYYYLNLILQVFLLIVQYFHFKMKRKYCAEIYTIIKVNKNTVDIENEQVELDGVKKN